MSNQNLHPLPRIQLRQEATGEAKCIRYNMILWAISIFLILKDLQPLPIAYRQPATLSQDGTLYVLNLTPRAPGERQLA